MGDSVEKSAKKAIKIDPFGLEKKLIRTGASSQRRDAKIQIAKQQQKESASLAEKDDEIARRRSRAAKGGRSSLIKSATPGLATNLGGTQ